MDNKNYPDNQQNDQPVTPLPEPYHPDDKPAPPPAPTPSTPPTPQPAAVPAPPFGGPVSPPPSPAAPLPAQPGQPGLMPQPVVRVLSPRGVEYVFMTIALVVGAIGLIAALLSMVNGKFSFSTLSVPVAILLVAVPVFGWLFLRLKNTELANPALALDASKRRSTQFIQIGGFVTCFFTLIGFLAALFAKMGGDYDGSLWKLILDVIVILAVAGGILSYYWKDEHQA